MIRFSKDFKLNIVITIDSSFTQEEKKKLREAVAIYKEAPKKIGLKAVLNAFIASAKLSTRYISEQNIIKMRRIVKDAPSRPVVMQLRQQGLLEGTYTKELGRGKYGYIVYYEVEKYLKRIIQLQVVGFANSVRLHKDGKLDHIYKKVDEIHADKREIREMNELRKQNTRKNSDKSQ